MVPPLLSNTTYSFLTLAHFRMCFISLGQLPGRDAHPNAIPRSRFPDLAFAILIDSNTPGEMYRSGATISRLVSLLSGRLDPACPMGRFTPAAEVLTLDGRRCPRTAARSARVHLAVLGRSLGEIGPVGGVSRTRWTFSLMRPPKRNGIRPH